MEPIIKGIWLAMDGRARFDVDEATVLEVVCEGVRHEVPRKAAKRRWADHDAVLCFEPKIEGSKTLGPTEYVEDI